MKSVITLVALAAVLPLAACNKSPSDKLADRVENAADNRADAMEANADVLRGRTVTSVPNIRKDLENAGANWKDDEVIVDKGLVTSRTPKDLPAFCAKLVEEIAEGTHGGQRRSA